MPNPLGQSESEAIPELDATLIWKKEPRYDSFLTAAAGAGVGTMSFFTVPRNTSGSGFIAPIVKPEADTNMSTPSQLGKPNQFLLFGFTVEALPATGAALAASAVASDWALIYHPGVFRFILGANNVQLEVPLEKIPTGCGPTGFATAGGVVTPLHMGARTNGVPDSSHYYNFTVPGSKLPLLINGDQTFRCEINYPVANLITVGIWRFRCYMHGVYGQGK